MYSSQYKRIVMLTHKLIRMTIDVCNGSLMHISISLPYYI